MLAKRQILKLIAAQKWLSLVLEPKLWLLGNYQKISKIIGNNSRDAIACSKQSNGDPPVVQRREKEDPSIHRKKCVEQPRYGIIIEIIIYVALCMVVSIFAFSCSGFHRLASTCII